MEVVFFNARIEAYLRSLEIATSTKSFRLVKLLKTFGNTLDMPYSKKISTNLYELRIRGQQEVRILYCFYQNQAIIVHAFIKKSQKTSLKEIQTALERIAILP